MIRLPSGPEDQPPMNGGEDGAHCCEFHKASNSTPQLVMFNGKSFHYYPRRSRNLLCQQQEDASHRGATATMVREDLHKCGRSQIERSDIFPSKKISVQFPHDSGIREDDLSNYFSIYGRVQEVSIPDQKKTMVGIVTFVDAETVEIVLAKGNPHFVRDSRVLVKPFRREGCFIEIEYGNI